MNPDSEKHNNILYLPDHKQREILSICAIIDATKMAEMIILFGSYARNTWVEDKYDDDHYRYQSDMDILVIVKTKSEKAHSKLEQTLRSEIENNKFIQTPVSIIIHDIDFVNRRLLNAQYFFTDIKKEGIVLFDSKNFTLKDAKTLLPKERAKLAQDDFNYYFKEADDFIKLVDFSMKMDMKNKAAFLLHQTAEKLYCGILLVFTRYKPNTHNLRILRQLSNSLSQDLFYIFPLDTDEDRLLFKLICKAYVDARYKPSYSISEDELIQLITKIEKLRNIGYTICLSRIANFTNTHSVDDTTLAHLDET